MLYKTKILLLRILTRNNLLIILLFVLIYRPLCCDASQTVQQKKDSLRTLIVSADSIEKVLLINTLARVYLNDSIDVGYKLIQGAYKNQTLQSYPRIKGDVLVTLALYEKNLNKFNDAIQTLQKVDSLYTISDYKIGKAGVLLNLGSLYKALGDYEKAIENYNLAFQNFEKEGNLSGMAKGLSNIGSIYYDETKYEKSLESYINALEIKESFNDDGSPVAGKSEIAYGLNRIAGVQWKLKQFEKAKYNFLKALSIFEEEKNLRGLSYTTAKLGVTYNSLQQYDSALYYHERALKIRQQLGIQKMIAYSYTGIYGVLRSLDENDEALEYAHKSLKIRKEIKDEKGTIINLKNIGEILLNQNKYYQSLNYFQQALTKAQNTEYDDLIAGIHNGMARIYGHQKQYQKAYEHELKYAILQDSIHRRNSNEEMARMQTIYETEKKEKQILFLRNEHTEKELELEKNKSQLERQFFISIGVLTLLLISAVILFLLFNRFKLKQKNRQTLLEKESLEYEGKLLRSQLNPHFIFNSLNSIQNFILKNEKAQASTYLIKFASLMRNVLNTSRKDMVSLEEDIEILRINLELEKLRLKNIFDFEITIDQNINIEAVYIPPMLMQPHVENAIKHGISAKENNGKIKLEISIHEGYLKCIIEDNGMGRKKSSLNKNNRYKSVASKLTKERFDLINRKTGVNVTQKIVDLKDENGNAIGTRVELLIPFETD